MSIPDASGHTVSLPAMSEPNVTSALAWASQNRSTNLALTLEKAWEDSHKVILEDQCPTVPVQAGEQTTPCRRAGTCLCSESGKQLKRMANRLLALMKEQFPNRHKKALLTEGKVVVHIGNAGACDQHEGVAPPATDLWLHVGHMSWSPYQPTFTVLQRLADTAPLQVGFQNRLVLKVCLLSF